MDLAIACGQVETGQVEPGQVETGQVPLDPNFVATINHGWVCEGFGQMGPPTGDFVLPLYWEGYNSDESTRVRVSLSQRVGSFADSESETQGPGSMIVTVGHNLLADEGDQKCDDVLSVSGDQQRIDASYVALAGHGTAIDDPGGVGVEISNVVLHTEGAEADTGQPIPMETPDVLIEQAILPSFSSGDASSYYGTVSNP